MKIPYDWLKEIVDISEPVQKVAEALSMSGTEVSSVSDNVIEVDILPNRGDCLSVTGVAREVCAALDKKMKPLTSGLKESGEDVLKSASVEVQAPDLCPRYMARVIKGIKVGESPSWMQKRLLDAGVRPINNIVDVTNYVMLETGQPLHAFDLSLLEGGKIIVRKARAGEKIVTLDGAERQLSADDLVIADQKKAVAVAGVMGAGNSEIGPGTKDILLESAFFSPVSVNRTSKNLKIRTEASVRFERGADFDGVKTSLDRAAGLIAELAGGFVLKGAIDVKSGERKPAVLKLRLERISKVLGADIPKPKAVSILSNLGFEVKDGGAELEVTVPSWRAADVEREIDLIEELARLYGFDNIGETFTFVRTESAEDDKVLSALKKERLLKQRLASLGFSEAKTYSMAGPALFKKAGIDIDMAVRIANPLIEDMTHLRTSLIPGLLEAAQYNLRHGASGAALFETGTVFGKKAGGTKEKQAVGGILYGSVFKGIVEKDRIREDFYFLKGIVDDIFDLYGSCCVEYLPTTDAKISSGMGAEIFCKGQKIGFVGTVREDIAAGFDMTRPAYVFEINMDYLNSLQPDAAKDLDLPRYPAVRRDIAMYIPAGLSHREIEERIMTDGGSLVEAVELFDRYAGKDKTSLAYSVVYRSKDKTLTDEEVNFAHEKILSSLESGLKVEIRK
jgi:phenylalanyl-tRNA synthetase beta chain